MSVNGDNERPIGYRWPGADEADLEAACARIARQIALGHARMVGLLPVFGGTLAGRRGVTGPEVELGPLLERLASSLAGFVGGTVGFVRSFRSWATEAPREGQPPHRIHQVRPDVVEIVPPRCRDSRSAATALQRSLVAVKTGIPCVLVDLGGYAPAGRLPAVAVGLDAVMPAIAAGVTWQSAVNRVWEKIPSDKRLGAILIG